MRAVAVLALISCGAIVLIFLFFLISLVDRFKARGLNIFIAALLIFNGEFYLLFIIKFLYGRIKLEVILIF